jgi:hypothetical protein
MPAREPDVAGFPCIGRDELAERRFSLTGRAATVNVRFVSWGNTPA